MTPSDALAALRARGADGADALRFRLVETLAARLQHSEGELRRSLTTRFERALQTLVDRIDAPANDTPPDARHRAPLAALVALRERLDGGADASNAPVELKSVRYFGDTWAQLSIERQIGESLQHEPAHAGPLNSHLLMLRSLAAMRELSPAYLQHFMIHVDALLSLASAVAARRTPPRPAGAKGRKRSASSRSTVR